MLTLQQLGQEFGTEEQCLAYVVRLRWPQGVRCVRCGNARVVKLARPWRWQCKQCNKQGYRFSPLVGTVFENTKYPLPIWFQVIYLLSQSKKGISALQIHRMIGSGSYRTAWSMCHRIRAALQPAVRSPLRGLVEVDETYVGGKEGKKRKAKRRRLSGTAGKIPVLGALSRRGAVVTQVIATPDTRTLQGFVTACVSRQAELVATDEHSGYRHLRAAGYRHETVCHGRGEYVRGRVHTQSIESFWAVVKRGLLGTFHHVSRRYLPLYLREFTFRHNSRTDPHRFERMLAGGIGG